MEIFSYCETSTVINLFISNRVLNRLKCVVGTKLSPLDKILICVSIRCVDKRFQTLSQLFALNTMSLLFMFPFTYVALRLLQALCTRFFIPDW